MVGTKIGMAGIAGRLAWLEPSEVGSEWKGMRLRGCAGLFKESHL